MTEQRLEKLRQGKCGQAFEKWIHDSPGHEPPGREVFEYFSVHWEHWAISWDAAMRELAEEAAAILMAADQEDAPTLDWGVCRAGLRKLADYGEEKN